MSLQLELGAQKVKYPYFIRRTYEKLLHHYNIHKANTIILSYPKCGRTWLRVLIAKTISIKHNTELNLQTEQTGKQLKIPIIYFSHKAHKYKNKNIILLSREPKDIIVSWYYHQKYRSKTYKGTLSEFIRDKELGIKNITEFNRQTQNNLKYHNKTLKCSYENLRQNTKKELKRILDFTNIKTNDKTINEAIKFAKFNNMKKMEKNNQFNSGLLNNRGGTKTLKCRKGKIGDYKKELSKKDIIYCNKAIQKVM